MLEFNVFHIKIDGISDEDLLRATVKVGFWDQARSENLTVEAPVYLEADLDASLRDLRERAKDAALELFRKTTLLLEQHSTDELHQASLDQAAKHEAEMEENMRANLEASLRDL